MALSEDLARVAERALVYAELGEDLAAVIPTEPEPGLRVYLCAYGSGAGGRAWLALDGEGQPIQSRALVRAAVTMAAMCEVAEETAGGGDLERLRAHLAELRARENPEGIDEAEEAAVALGRVIASEPRLASPAYLDEMGAATRRLEQALGTEVQSPFAEAMKVSVGALEELAREVEAGYRLELR